MTTGPAFDWGHPQPPDFEGPFDALHCRIPSALLFELRERARRDGTSLEVLVRHLLDDALLDEHDRVLEAALRDHAR